MQTHVLFFLFFNRFLCSIASSLHLFPPILYNNFNVLKWICCVALLLLFFFSSLRCRCTHFFFTFPCIPFPHSTLSINKFCVCFVCVCESRRIFIRCVLFSPSASRLLSSHLIFISSFERNVYGFSVTVSSLVAFFLSHALAFSMHAATFMRSVCACMSANLQLITGKIKLLNMPDEMESDQKYFEIYAVYGIAKNSRLWVIWDGWHQRNSYRTYVVLYTHTTRA